MNSFCKFMEIGLEQQKLEFNQKQAEARQRAREQKIRARKPIVITPQAVAAALSAVTQFLSPAAADAGQKSSPEPGISSPASIAASTRHIVITSNSGASEIIDFNCILPAVCAISRDCEVDCLWHESDTQELSPDTPELLVNSAS